MVGYFCMLLVVWLGCICYLFDGYGTSHGIGHGVAFASWTMAICLSIMTKSNKE